MTPNIDGTLSESEDGTVVRFERMIDRPVAKVWAALTDPKILANWLGDVEIEPRLGGKFIIRFRDMPEVMSGAITAFEAERLLEYSWSENNALPASLARWELSPAGRGCRLVLTHRFPRGMARKDIIPFLGGWQAFLDVLPRAVDGIFVPYREEAHYRVQYRAKYP